MSGDLFGPGFGPSLERQIECVDREVKLRRRSYPGRVETHRMTKAKAAEEIAVMEAVGETLRRLLPGR